ncbi:MAG: aspartyl-phosphate phosphatase Spo0E family protein [Tumebacillaceae bacterium]
MGESFLEQTIEDLRQQMIDRAEETGNLLDSGVIRMSQQLDKFLVQLQRLRMQRRSIAS